MANLTIHKFRFQETIGNWKDQKIVFSSTANELLDKLGESEHLLIICALASKDDLLQIVSFFQKKKQYIKGTPCTIILIDFQSGEKLLEAAQRLSFDKIIPAKDYLVNEESIIASNLQGKTTSHQTYEDLFSGNDKLVLKKNTKHRLYPIEEITRLPSGSQNEIITETPIVTFRLYVGEKLIESTFNDYFDREVYLTTKNLPEDNHLTLEFKFSYQGKKKGLRLKAEVTNIEEFEGEYQLTLKVESHLVEFEAMLKIYQEREQNINTFMKKVKGH